MEFRRIKSRIRKRGGKMIDELKFMIDESERMSPKVKEILLKVAQMPENKQADTLKLLRMIV